MSDLTRTVEMVRFIVRRDRMRIIVWVTAITVLVWLMAASVKELYPTQAVLDEAAAALHGNAAAIAFNGPDQGLDTLGGQVAFQVGTISLVVAMMSIFMIGRATRGEEESGRLELIRSMAVGARAPGAAALIVAGTMSVIVGALVTLGLIVMDLPVAGSVVFGAGFAAVGLMFSGVALVAAQVTENTAMVYGASAAVLGAAFAVRAAGDIGNGALTWLSPIGWVQKARPYAGERWWPMLLPAALVVLLVIAAAALAVHRDVGAGLVRPRPGNESATPGLGTPVGLAVRLQRGTVIGWSVGIFLASLVFGLGANSVEDYVGDNEAMQDLLDRSGGVSLTDSYLAYTVFIAALIAGGFSISAARRLRTEETALRAEPVLATPTSRHRWVLGHLAVAFTGSVIVLVAAGLGAGLGHGLVIRDIGQIPRLIGAAVTYLPAAALLTGLTVAAFGLLPRAIAAAWGLLALCLVVGLLGESLDLPRWLRYVSPFEHTPQLPADGMNLAPLSIIVALVILTTSAGLIALRHRDIG